MSMRPRGSWQIAGIYAPAVLIETNKKAETNYKAEAEFVSEARALVMSDAEHGATPPVVNWMCPLCSGLAPRSVWAWLPLCVEPSLRSQARCVFSACQ